MPVQPGVATSLTTQAGKEARGLRDGGSTSYEKRWQEDPLSDSNHHRSQLSRTHPPAPHLCRWRATLRLPAAHPRVPRALSLPAGRSRSLGRHPVRCGWSGEAWNSHPPLFPLLGWLNKYIYTYYYEMRTYSIPTTYNQESAWVRWFPFFSYSYSLYNRILR